MKQRTSILLLITILIFACSKVENFDIMPQLNNSVWTRDSYQFDNSEPFREFQLKNKYYFNSDGTYLIEMYWRTYNISSSIPTIDTISRSGVWNYNEIERIIDFDRFEIGSCNYDSLIKGPLIISDTISLSIDALFSDYKVIDNKNNVLIVQPFINEGGCEYKEKLIKIK